MIKLIPGHGACHESARTLRCENAKDHFWAFNLVLLH